MRMIIVSGGVALILSLLGTPLAIRVFSGRGDGHMAGDEAAATRAAKRGTPTMGGAVIVIASLTGFFTGHALARDPITASGIQVLALMTGLGLVGLLGDVIKIHRRASLGQRGGAKLAHGLDGLQAAAAVLVLAGYVLIADWQLRNDCAVLLTKNCYVVRDPLDLAAVAASAFGGCFGFLCWNARRVRIFIGATGTFALGGVLAGLAVTAHTQWLLAAGGLFVIITLSVMRRWAVRLAIR